MQQRSRTVREMLQKLLITVVALIAFGAGVFFFFRRASHKNDDAALRAALESYLSQQSGLNMSGMNMDFKSVDVHGDHATAQVEFRAKQGDAHMQMTYQFMRQGGVWVVQNSSGTAGSGHPAIPQGMAPTETGQLPPGHPAIPAAADPHMVHGTGNPTPAAPAPKQ